MGAGSWELGDGRRTMDGDGWCEIRFPPQSPLGPVRLTMLFRIQTANDHPWMRDTARHAQSRLASLDHLASALYPESIQCLRQTGHTRAALQVHAGCFRPLQAAPVLPCALSFSHVPAAHSLLLSRPLLLGLGDTGLTGPHLIRPWMPPQMNWPPLFPPFNHQCF